MKKSDELKQQRAAKMEDISGLIKAAEQDENRDFTPEEQEKFDALEAEVRELDGKIEAQERREAMAARAASLAGGAGSNEPAPEQREQAHIFKRASLSKAIYRGGSNSLDGAEKELHEIGLEEYRQSGVKTEIRENAILIPQAALRATAQTVTEDSGNYGGSLVVDQPPRVQMGFAAGSILEDLGVNYMRNLSGGGIPLPVAGTYAFNWLTETGAITPSKQTMTGPTLSPKRVGAAVQVSNRLLIQSSADAEAIVRNNIIRGYNSTLSAAAINGSGNSNEPEGVLNNAGIGAGSSTDADVPTKALVAELIKLVLEANSSMESLAFLGSPAVQHLLDTTEISSGSGRFIKEAMDSLLGYRFKASTHVPQLNSNEVLIFGDWSQLFVGEWGPISVFVNPYAASLSDSVQLELNAHADVAIAQPGAFAANTYFNAVDTP